MPIRKPRARFSPEVANPCLTERSNRASIGLRIAPSMRSNRCAKVTFKETLPSLLRTRNVYTTPPSASVRLEATTRAFVKAGPSVVVLDATLPAGTYTYRVSAGKCSFMLTVTYPAP